MLPGTSCWWHHSVRIRKESCRRCTRWQSTEGHWQQGSFTFEDKSIFSTFNFGVVPSNNWKAHPPFTDRRHRCCLVHGLRAKKAIRGCVIGIRRPRACSPFLDPSYPGVYIFLTATVTYEILKKAESLIGKDKASALKAERWGVRVVYRRMSQVFAMKNQWIYADNSAFCCTWIIRKKFFWSALQFF